MNSYSYSFFSNYRIRLPLVFVSILYLIGTTYISYFVSREAFSQLIYWWGLLFVCFGILYKSGMSKEDVFFLLGLSILSRIILLCHIPNLSEDYARFIWDGRISFFGENPFLYTPTHILSHPDNFPVEKINHQGLFWMMNSPQYYTIYPAICQYIYALSIWIFPKNILGNIIVIKSFFLLAEIGTIISSISILQKKEINKPIKVVLLYALNPFIVIELMGNMHFEAIMICFLSLFMLFMFQKKYNYAAIFFALAISTKMLPLILAPYIFLNLPSKVKWLFFFRTFIIILLLHFPFFDVQFVQNLSQSISLYAQSFEFNASFYYLFRKLGYLYKGYNWISIIGPLMWLITIITILSISIIRRHNSFYRFPNMALTLWLVYLFFATTVHPWYIAVPLFFSIFTSSYIALAWSILLPLTYITYQEEPYKENSYVLMIEYGIIFVLCLFSYISSQTKLKKQDINCYI